MCKQNLGPTHSSTRTLLANVQVLKYNYHLPSTGSCITLTGKEMKNSRPVAAMNTKMQFLLENIRLLPRFPAHGQDWPHSIQQPKSRPIKLFKYIDSTQKNVGVGARSLETMYYTVQVWKNPKLETHFCCAASWMLRNAIMEGHFGCFDAWTQTGKFNVAETHYTGKHITFASYHFQNWVFFMPSSFGPLLVSLVQLLFARLCTIGFHGFPFCAVSLIWRVQVVKCFVFSYGQAWVQRRRQMKVIFLEVKMNIMNQIACHSSGSGSACNDYIWFCHLDQIEHSVPRFIKISSVLGHTWSRIVISSPRISPPRLESQTISLTARNEEYRVRNTCQKFNALRIRTNHAKKNCQDLRSKLSDLRL